MIELSSTDYHLKGVSQDFFWKELENITVGQTMNPEFGYSTPHFGKFENVFGGRKVDNEFSIYLYRPVTQMVRTEILAKGIVSEHGSGIMVKCRFEYPFWSLLMLFMLGTAVLYQLYIRFTLVGLIATLIGILIYFIIIQYNHSNIKSVLNRQLKIIEEKANKEE